MQREITLVKRLRRRVRSEFYKGQNSSRKTKVKKKNTFCSVTVWSQGTTTHVTGRCEKGQRTKILLVAGSGFL